MARELLGKALAAHGGLARWSCFATVQATIVTGGQLFGMKGTPQDSMPRRMTVAAQREWASVFPNGADDGLDRPLGCFVFVVNERCPYAQRG